MSDDTPTQQVLASSPLYLDKQTNPIRDALDAINLASRETRTAAWDLIRQAVDAEVEADGPSKSEPPAYRPTPEPKASLVYYLRFADRIKIGVTTNLDHRLTAIPHDELLATEPGDRHLENSRHAQFAHLRVTGEWFQQAPELMAHITSLP